MKGFAIRLIRFATRVLLAIYLAVALLALAFPGSTEDESVIDGKKITQEKKQTQDKQLDRQLISIGKTDTIEKDYSYYHRITLMEAADTLFEKLDFEDMQKPSYRFHSLPRAILQNLVLLVRTNEGNYAKMHIFAGEQERNGNIYNLKIEKLVVYNKDGSQNRAPGEIPIPQTYSYDLDNFRFSGLDDTATDIYFNAKTPEIVNLDTVNNAGIGFPEEIVLCRSGFQAFDQTEYLGLSNLDYTVSPIPLNLLYGKKSVVLFRTNENNIAKLIVEASEWDPERPGLKELIIHRLVLYDRLSHEISIVALRIRLQSSDLFDLDKVIKSSDGDLFWNAVSNNEYYLRPDNGAELIFPAQN